MNKVEIVEVSGLRVKFTVTQRHVDAVGMSVVLEEDLLKLVATTAFGLDDNYQPKPTAPLGEALGSDEVFFDGSGPARFKDSFRVVESNVIRERADDFEINQALDARGLARGSGERDDAFYQELDARRGLLHVTLEALDPKWATHLEAGVSFEI